jgi:post-segregation antitoxin (ccd killing protein)
MCYVARDGSVSVSTTVLIPRPLKDEARRLGISLSGTLTEALKVRIEDLEREGGKP